METFAILFYLLILFLLCATLLFLLYCILPIVITRAPFININPRAVPEILKALDLKGGSVFYDLGCGDGRVVRAAAEAQPGARCIGVDKAHVPVWLARWRARNVKTKNLTFLRENIFTMDLSDATQIYTFLYPKPMQILLPRFENILRPGTRVVDGDFPIHGRTPVRIIPLQHQDKFGRTLYVYEF
ncbi:methyltransferase domain-containing protein [Candidatus Uhrbacteria bacterium]|nr:methyltransferase domain-containing protein [Candidatus Uhrbacteria bacterium]